MKVGALRAQLLPNAGKCWSIVFDKSNTWIVCAGVISPMREVKSSLVVMQFFYPNPKIKTTDINIMSK
jgi:hypothetical protein